MNQIVEIRIVHIDGHVKSVSRDLIELRSVVIKTETDTKEVLIKQDGTIQ